MSFNKPDPSVWKPLVVRELLMKAIRSRGPGGQHVNRTESAVQIVWDLKNTSIFDEAQKHQLHQKLKNYLNLDGILQIRIESERSLLRNKEIGIKKLLMLIEKSFETPKKRFKTKPTRSSVEKRIKSKSVRSQTKKLRKVDSDWD